MREDTIDESFSKKNHLELFFLKSRIKVFPVSGPFPLQRINRYNLFLNRVFMHKNCVKRALSIQQNIPFHLEIDTREFYEFSIFPPTLVIIYPFFLLNLRSLTEILLDFQLDKQLPHI